MKIFKTTGRGAKQAEALLTQLENRSSQSLETVLPKVWKILRAVRDDGDAALFKFAAKFDGLAAGTLLRVSPEETAAAWTGLDPALQAALETAAANIREFAVHQLPESFAFSPIPGLMTGQLVRPLDSVGCYVPGGRHPLPSTMLMTVIPAQVAGVARIVVASPRPAQETLATAHLLGVTEFYRIGGAHAVAALAFGTESIAKVAKIVGPGNLYVTAAKREIAFDCGIDMLAGPTEIVVTSDQGASEAIAADLVAQAEHDPAALAILVTTKETLAEAVRKAAKRLAKTNATAREAQEANGYIFIAGSSEEAQTITNRLAPEHLTVDSAADVEWVRNAGSVFVGLYSPQPMGDYISGPNHTLPTGGMAAIRGGLSVNDFVKLITVQEYSAEGLAELGPKAARLADAEGLTGHAEAIRQRLQRMESEP
jgi:histidinol dehydrogenase